jgi:hypothetical protein
MPNRFLREIGDMHQLWKDIRSANAEEFMKRLGNDAAADCGRLRYSPSGFVGA